LFFEFAAKVMIIFVACMPCQKNVPLLYLYLLLIMKRCLFMLTMLCTTHLQAQQEELFNGRDLSGWNFVVADDTTPAERVFSVDDGAILVQGKPFGYMHTLRMYADYRLEVEWAWVDAPSNSGIFFLITDALNPFPRGIECQLKAGSAGDMIMLSGAALEGYEPPAGSERPAFPQIKKRQDSNEKPAGEWNKAVVELLAGKITIHINDALQNSAASAVKTGYIGLQSEGGRIRFRNIKLTHLK
jgi:hypothetical protein